MSLILKVVWETADATSLDLHEKKRETERPHPSISYIEGSFLFKSSMKKIKPNFSRK